MLKRTLYLLLIFSLLGVIEPARADIEAPQPIIGTIRTGIEQAKEVQEEIDSLQTEIRSAAEGIAGPIKETVNTVNDVKDQTTSAIKEGQEAVNSAKDAAQNAVKDPTSALSSQGAQIPNFLSSVDTYDTEALSSAVQKNYFMQRPKSTTTTSNNNSETIETSSSSEETTDLTELQKAQEEKVEIHLHDIIYALTEEIENAMKGMMKPVEQETILGQAEVRQIFTFSKVGTIAGCYVTEGSIKRGAQCRIIRNGVVIYTSKIKSLRREKDDASEVKKGFECGITIENYNDEKEEDIIEAFEVRLVERQ